MNPMMQHGNGLMNSGYSPNANVSMNMNGNVGGHSNPLHNASAPSMGSIQRGNQSVLNVLTGEPSPPESYPVTSAEVTPKKNVASPVQATPGKAVSPKAALPQQTKGADPFGGMDDPFADMGAPSFDTPSQGIKSMPPQKAKPMSAPPATLHKANSDNLIIDMFASGGPPDPNEKKVAAASPPKAKGSDNPFDVSNPFGSSADMASTDKVDNPFEDLEDNPFGDSGGDVVSEDNPFAMFTPVHNQQSAKKQDDFMGDRDPFADM